MHEKDPISHCPFALEAANGALVNYENGHGKVRRYCANGCGVYYYIKGNAFLRTDGELKVGNYENCTRNPNATI